MVKLKNGTTYEPLILPFNKSPEQFTDNEAVEYFDWFISNIDERSDYLRRIVAESLSISINHLDYTASSLVPIWKWFLSVAEIRKTSMWDQMRFAWSLRGNTASFIKAMTAGNNTELSILTEYILRDIGMYISKVLMLPNATLRWTIFHEPKSDANVNIPLISGFVDNNPDYPMPFYPLLDPVDLARTPAMKLFEGTASEVDLMNRCNEWLNLIPVD